MCGFDWTRALGQFNDDILETRTEVAGKMGVPVAQSWFPVFVPLCLP